MHTHSLNNFVTIIICRHCGIQLYHHPYFLPTTTQPMLQAVTLQALGTKPDINIFDLSLRELTLQQKCRKDPDRARTFECRLEGITTENQINSVGYLLTTATPNRAYTDFCSRYLLRNKRRWNKGRWRITCRRPKHIRNNTRVVELGNDLICTIVPQRPCLS